MVIVWRLSDHSKIKTVPVFDSIEGLVLVPGAGLVLGSGTRLRLWDADMTRQKKEVDLGSEVVCVRPGAGVVHRPVRERCTRAKSLLWYEISSALLMGATRKALLPTCPVQPRRWPQMRTESPG